MADVAVMSYWKDAEIIKLTKIKLTGAVKIFVKMKVACQQARTYLEFWNALEADTTKNCRILISMKNIIN